MQRQGPREVIDLVDSDEDDDEQLLASTNNSMHQQVNQTLTQTQKPATSFTGLMHNPFRPTNAVSSVNRAVQVFDLISDSEEEEEEDEHYEILMQRPLQRTVPVPPAFSASLLVKTKMEDPADCEPKAKRQKLGTSQNDIYFVKREKEPLKFGEANIEGELVEIAMNNGEGDVNHEEEGLCTSSSNNGNKVIDLDCEDVIEFVGGNMNVLSDMPHQREACSGFKWVPYPYDRVANMKCCNQCYCYVCDINAKDCPEWREHCNASYKNPHFKAEHDIRNSKLLLLLPTHMRARFYFENKMLLTPQDDTTREYGQLVQPEGLRFENMLRKASELVTASSVDSSNSEELLLQGTVFLLLSRQSDMVRHATVLQMTISVGLCVKILFHSQCTKALALQIKGAVGYPLLTLLAKVLWEDSAINWIRNGANIDGDDNRKNDRISTPPSLIAFCSDHEGICTVIRALVSKSSTEIDEAVFRLISLASVPVRSSVCIQASLMMLAKEFPTEKLDAYSKKKRLYGDSKKDISNFSTKAHRDSYGDVNQGGALSNYLSCIADNGETYQTGALSNYLSSIADKSISVDRKEDPINHTEDSDNLTSRHTVEGVVKLLQSVTGEQWLRHNRYWEVRGILGNKGEYSNKVMAILLAILSKLPIKPPVCLLEFCMVEVYIQSSNCFSEVSVTCIQKEMQHVHPSDWVLLHCFDNWTNQTVCNVAVGLCTRAAHMLPKVLFTGNAQQSSINIVNNVPLSQKFKSEDSYSFNEKGKRIMPITLMPLALEDTSSVKPEKAAVSGWVSSPEMLRVLDDNISLRGIVSIIRETMDLCTYPNSALVTLPFAVDSTFVYSDYVKESIDNTVIGGSSSSSISVSGTSSSSSTINGASSGYGSGSAYGGIISSEIRVPNFIPNGHEILSQTVNTNEVINECLANATSIATHFIFNSEYYKSNGNLTVVYDMKGPQPGMGLAGGLLIDFLPCEIWDAWCTHSIETCWCYPNPLCLDTSPTICLPEALAAARLFYTGLQDIDYSLLPQYPQSLEV